MPREQRMLGYLEDVVYGRRRGITASIVRALLGSFSCLYSVSIRFYLWLFDSGIRRKHRLNRPVISVGNITVGGTGKTPVVQYIARELLSLGCHPAVLSYGYGGALAGGFGVVSDKSGVLLNASTAGDEPVMLAESLPGVPVLVCKHRYISGRTAISDHGADALILDDGFQVWKLHRDLDIVLLSADGLFDNGRTLPAGRLREPVSSLNRAGCIIVTSCTDDNSQEMIKDRIRRLCAGVPVFFAAYRPDALIPLSGGRAEGVDALGRRRAFAVSSIGNPASFERTLEDSGAIIAGSLRYPDHYGYTRVDAARIMNDASDASADLIITTMKDAVKLRCFDIGMPAYSLGITLDLSDKDKFRRVICGIVGRPLKDDNAV